MLMRVKTSSPDFSYVSESQMDIHVRLENWARSSYSGSGGSVQPMFRGFKTNFARGDDRAVPIPCDQRDAAKIQIGVSKLPPPHREAIQWCYIKKGSPVKQCRKQGLTMEGLALMIQDGRTMLKNRGV